jgi:O-methyltransferase
MTSDDHAILRVMSAGVLGQFRQRRAHNPNPGPEVPPLRHIPDEPALITVPRPGMETFAVWPDTPPPDYLGQLEPDFQRILAERWAGVTLADCFFYHRSALADGRVVEGVWNLIGGEEEYLGGIGVAGKTVLELGPASGWLTVWMEQQGASVVAFDLGWDACADLLPIEGHDIGQMSRDHARLVSHIANTWWFLQRDHQLSSRAAYGSIYELPDDLGRFDVAVFGSILLHLRDPFRALEQAAAHTDHTIVVVEPLRDPTNQLDEPIMLWNVTRGQSPNGWWSLSPGAIKEMLAMLGFTDQTVTFHHQPYQPENEAPQEPTAVPNYTVVARRPSA